MRRCQNTICNATFQDDTVKVCPKCGHPTMSPYQAEYDGPPVQIEPRPECNLVGFEVKVEENGDVHFFQDNEEVGIPADLIDPKMREALELLYQRYIAGTRD